VIIVTCVRWYLRFPLSARDVEELIAERGLSVDHTTIWRWAQKYGPELYRQLHGHVKRKSSMWHIDETFVRVGGRQIYLFRAVDSQGQTVDFYSSETRDREAAKIFLRKASVRQRWTAELLGGKARAEGGGQYPSDVPPENSAVRKQPCGIRSPTCETASASDAVAENKGHCGGRHSGS
jgi:transposase-like protein